MLDFVDGFVFVLLDDGVQHRTDVIGCRMVTKRRIGRQQIDIAQAADKLGALAADGDDVAFNLVVTVVGCRPVVSSFRTLAL